MDAGASGRTGAVQRRPRRRVFGLVAGLGLAASAASAQTIVDEWATVTAPPAPALKPVALDPKTTALLMLDFVAPNCTQRPRCMASVPAVKKLLTEARAKGMLIVYATGATGKRADTVPELGGTQTVIAMGTAAHGAVLYTASAAALRGMKVIVPVDGMSANTLYPEQYTAWHLVNAPVVSTNVTLTKLDLIKF